jgi:daunorubicin/doxorubicin transport system permease protein
VIIVLGLILGFRPDNGVPGVLAAVGLVVLFSFGVSWVFTSLGLVMRSPNATMNAGFMAIFPLTFLSNVYVEPDTLPSGLEAFVNANPISHLTSACRGLLDGSLDAENLIVVLGTTALLTAIFLPLTTYLYRRA